MAEASTATIVVTTTVPAIVLKLTAEEAMTLKLILNRIGGNPEDTIRGYAQRINEALRPMVAEFSTYEHPTIIGSADGITCQPGSKSHPAFVKAVAKTIENIKKC
jgi:hypothetical protein